MDGGHLANISNFGKYHDRVHCVLWYKYIIDMFMLAILIRINVAKRISKQHNSIQYNQNKVE